MHPPTVHRHRARRHPPPPSRLKDVIFGFGSSSVYVVLECLDCDLRDLLDRDDAAVDMRQAKVRRRRRRRGRGVKAGGAAGMGRAPQGRAQAGKHRVSGRPQALSWQAGGCRMQSLTAAAAAAAAAPEEPCQTSPSP